jgi:hypothetical protein
VLPLDVVQGVADYYAEERVYLAKCQQFIVMTASECLIYLFVVLWGYLGDLASVLQGCLSL